MMNQNEISHEGTIIAVGEGSLQVSIHQQAACAACKAATHCIAAEGKSMTVDIANVDASSYAVGERVRVVETQQVALRALVWAFVIPLAVMFFTLAIVTYFTGSEAAGALSSLVALMACFLVLRLMRDKLARELRFSVSKIA
ncbi:MAG: SoxR reducing system RseC family protein [Prevotella sp.]|nr:SoxR reducing system RseC family protein [Prevotella sp.]